MSNSTDTTGCISHKPNTRFFVIYDDFLQVASVSEHQYKLAAFWRVLETKTNDRQTYYRELKEANQKKGLADPEENYWIEIPYSEFVHRALGSYKSSSFQIAAAESERLGFSKSRVQKRPRNPQDPQSPMEDYKEYYFCVDAMQAVLNGGEYPTPIEINSPLLKNKKERKLQGTPIEINSPPIEINSPSSTDPLLKSIAPPIENNRKKYSNKNSNKNIENISVTQSSNDDAPAEKILSSSVSPEKVMDENLIAKGEQKKTTQIPLALSSENKKDPPAKKTPVSRSTGVSEKDQTFWKMWLKVDQNRRVTPPFNATAKGHVAEIAKHIQDQSQIDALVAYTRQKLREKSKNPNVWMVALGDIRNHLDEWLRTNKAASQPTLPLDGTHPSGSRLPRPLELTPLEKQTREMQKKFGPIGANFKPGFKPNNNSKSNVGNIHKAAGE